MEIFASRNRTKERVSNKNVNILKRNVSNRVEYWLMFSSRSVLCKWCKWIGRLFRCRRVHHSSDEIGDAFFDRTTDNALSHPPNDEEERMITAQGRRSHPNRQPEHRRRWCARVSRALFVHIDCSAVHCKTHTEVAVARYSFRSWEARYWFKLLDIVN